MTLREGTAQDREAILRIRPQAAGWLSGGEGNYLLIAEENGELLGVAAVFRRKIPAPVAREEAFVNLIEVLEEGNRGKGIGTSLVREIPAREREIGTYQVRAYCEISNVASHRLWAGSGFGMAPVKIGESVVGSYVTYVLGGSCWRRFSDGPLHHHRAAVPGRRTGMARARGGRSADLRGRRLDGGAPSWIETVAAHR